MTPNGAQAPPASDRTTPAGQPTVTELVSGILSDAQTLVKQQVTMFRAELKEDIRRTKEATRYLGVGAGLVSLGSLFLVVSLVYLLGWLVPSLPEFACWAIVGGVLAVAGGIALAVGQHLFNKFNPLPDKTFTALQENVTWIANSPPK